MSLIKSLPAGVQPARGPRCYHALTPPFVGRTGTRLTGARRPSAANADQRVGGPLRVRVINASYLLYQEQPPPPKPTRSRSSHDLARPSPAMPGGEPEPRALRQEKGGWGQPRVLNTRHTETPSRSQGPRGFASRFARRSQHFTASGKEEAASMPLSLLASLPPPAFRGRLPRRGSRAT